MFLTCSHDYELHPHTTVNIKREKSSHNVRSYPDK